MGAPQELDEQQSKRACTEDTVSVKSGISDMAIDSPVNLPVAPVEKPFQTCELFVIRHKHDGDAHGCPRV